MTYIYAMSFEDAEESLLKEISTSTIASVDHHPKANLTRNLYRAHFWVVAVEPP